jgi:hypothetical protein
MRTWLPFCCLIVLHSPDNRELQVESQYIEVMRPAEAARQHVTPGTQAILYVGAQRFGVIESIDQINIIIRNCLSGGK